MNNHQQVNYERFPEGLNPYELSDLLAGIRQLTTDLAKEHGRRELTFHEKQKLDLLLDNMNWKLPELKIKTMKVEEDFSPLIIWFGENIFPQKTTDVLKLFGGDLVLRAVVNKLLVTSRSKIGTSPTQMRAVKGYLELSNIGWEIYGTATPEEKELKPQP